MCKEVLPSKSGLITHFLHFTTYGNVNPSVQAIVEAAQQADIDRATSLARATSELDPCVHSDFEETMDYRFDFAEDYPENEAEPDVVANQEDVNARLADHGNFAGVHFVTRQAGIAHTVDDQHAEIKLIKILDDANVPHYLFKVILDLSADAKAHGYVFRPTRRYRPAPILSLEK
jgi:hypothetical protein